MPAKARYILVYSLVFLGASLFFAITKEIARDVAQAREIERGKEIISKLPKAVASSTAKVATVNIASPSKDMVLDPTLSTYISVTDGCEAYYGGECLLVRSGPGKEFPVVTELRNGIVLKVSETIKTGTSTWHKIVFDEWLRYPERVKGDWYVSGDYVEVFQDTGDQTEIHKPAGTSTKKIVVKRSTQTLTAYDGDNVFMTATTSTGKDNAPTPRGTFEIIKKTPSRYMQGPLTYLEYTDYYDLPGVPWTMYFNNAGAAIHGAYWHDKFGTQHSHGCVNLTPAEARKIYDWAEIGTKVIVQD